MRSQFLLAAIVCGSLLSPASAQSQSGQNKSAKPLPTPSGRTSARTPPGSSSSFLVGGSDDCSTADAIAGLGTFAVNTTSATDSTQQTGFCPPAHNDVWFAWTSSISGTVQLSMCGSTSADTVIAVYPGTACPTAGSQLACNDDFCGLQSQTSFTATNGSQYLIQLGAFGTGTTYTGQLTIAPPPPPPTNDECTLPTAVTGTGPFPFDNSLATTSAQGQTESACLFFGSTSMQHDVWFTWTAGATGLATFATCGNTTVDTKIAVYAGAGCPSSGTALACNDDNCATFQSSVDFNATAGAQYTLQIGTYPGAMGGAGSFTVNIPPPPPPPSPGNFNVDIGSPTGGYGVPTSAYGAAAAQPGYWNARSVSVSSALLNDTSGTLNGATLTRTGTNLFDFAFNNAGTTGDDERLMDDAQDVGGTGGTTTWTFSNLWGGNYAVYTYAWAPDNASYVSIVSSPTSSDPAQNVGGAWPGTQVLGVTYALHHFTGIPTGGGFALTIATGTTFGTLNGFQLVLEGSSVTTFCSGDGTATACPCANNGTAGNGCANSVVAAGAHLAGSGTASVGNDSFLLDGTGMPNSSALYFQGTSQLNGGLGIAFGDGLRCVGGAIIRLGTKSNSGGASHYPAAGDPSISVRGLDNPGDVRTYQIWYRNADPTFCTPSTFNLSNGAQITWAP